MKTVILLGILLAGIVLVSGCVGQGEQFCIDNGWKYPHDISGAELNTCYKIINDTAYFKPFVCDYNGCYWRGD